MNKATQLSSQNNTLNLDIEGMTCAACAARIERVISKQENVLDVSVNIDKKLVEVNSTDAIDMGVVTSLLDEQGYTVVESN